MAPPPDASTLDRPWVRSYPPGVPPDYSFPAVALTRFLDDAVRDFPERDALATARETVDYATLGERVAAVAAVLARIGIEAGERVLVALPNHATTPVVLFALWRLPAVVVPVDPALSSERLAAIAEDAGVGAIVGTGHVLSTLRGREVAATTWLQVDGAEWPTHGRWPGLRPVRRLRRLARRIGWSGRSTVLRRGVQPPEQTTDAGPPPFQAPTQLGVVLEATGAETQAGAAVATRHDARPDQAAVIVYDAGPDADADEACGIVFSHANLVASAFQARLWVPDVQAGRERVLVADRFDDLAPLSLGLLAGVLAAATVVLADEPDAAGLARIIDRDRPTLLTTRPDRLAGLVSDGDAARRDLTSLRVILACGAPVDPDLAVGLERRTDGARLRGCFGVPEAGPLTHAHPVYGRVAPGSMGLPVTSTVAAVVDPDDLGSVREPGVPGVLLLSGPQVAGGYWRSAALSSSRFTGGWLVTDDLVRVDDQGLFRYVGRRDEVIDRDGGLVSPRHVEATLEHHPGVRQAGVVTSQDGALLLAAVVTRRRSRPEPDDLIAYCRAHLDSQAVPDRVIVLPSLPRTEAGELARDELSRDLASRLS